MLPIYKRSTELHHNESILESWEGFKLKHLGATCYLTRAPQTMRIWAMKEHPIRPLRVHGRLACPVAEIKRLLGMEAA